MKQRIKLRKNGLAWPHSLIVGSGFYFVTRFVDLLVVPWVLNGKTVYVYVIARLLALVVPLSLMALGGKVAVTLYDLAQINEGRSFQAAAARVNLGCLMICGAVSLLVLLIAPHFSGMLGDQYPEFIEILVWLVIGNLAPALFGATHLLMNALGRGEFYNLLSGVTSLLTLISLAVLPELNGLLIAQIVAAAQLSHSAICALLLTQSGVWPGLTALFHKEMKLF